MRCIAVLTLALCVSLIWALPASAAPNPIVLDHSYVNGAYRYTFENGRSFSASIPNGAVTNSAVSFSFDEGLLCLLEIDGESRLYEEGEIFTEDGEYYLTVISPVSAEEPDFSMLEGDFSDIDVAALEEYEIPTGENMQTMFSFRIVNSPTRDIPVFNAAHGFSIKSVTLDNAPVLPGGAYSSSLIRDGVYTITLEDETSAAPDYTVRFEQRRTPPGITLDGVARFGTTAGKVTVGAVEGVEIEVYRNGVRTGAAGTYSENGSYRVRATDAAGNTSQAEFKIVFSLPKPLVLVGALALLTAACVYVLHARNSMKL